MNFPVTPSGAYVARRRALAADCAGPILLLAGAPPPRNYPANTYPFRPSSHYLYFGGPSEAGAALLLEGSRSTLYLEPRTPEDALWHGPRPGFDAVGEAWGVNNVRALDSLGPDLRAGGGIVAALSPQDAASARLLSDLRASGSPEALSAADDLVAAAVIKLRLHHDEAATAQLRAAAEASAEAHLVGMAAARTAKTENDVCAAITNALRLRGMEDAYAPIVSVKGEVLHNVAHDGALTPGDLLLCDAGGETPEGWASDITRTWPVSGRFSTTQRAIYDVVLAAQEAAISRVRPGVSYREVHETAKRTIVSELVKLRILRGNVDGLLERGAAFLFFPHGVGHLIGLDVHDMEDMGDRAGYAPGRERSRRFGDKYLRLDRDLAPGMAVTIEPGFYQVPEIMNDPELTGPLGSDLDRNVLSSYADVRGIRIEDDVLCTLSEPVVLSARCPKSAQDVEAAVNG